MYKVFIDNHPILFLKSSEAASNVPIRYGSRLSTADFSSFSGWIRHPKNTESPFIKSPEPLEGINLFFSNFTWIEAAGGIVKNTKSNELLFILRNEIWDLPKGKIEVKESPSSAALREIKEECGLVHLKITASLESTYHAYYAYDKYWIKKTHWFVLETNEKDTFPQEEEGITEVKWFKNDQLKDICENSYSSILEVLKEYKLLFTH